MSEIALVNRVAAEADSRKFQRATVPIVSIDQADVGPDNIGVPGTLTVLLAPSGHEVVLGMRQAASVDPANAFRMLQELGSAGRNRQAMPLERAVDAAVEANTLADVRYATKTLAQNVAVFDDDFTALSFPYNGGPIDSEALKIVEKYKDAPGVEAVAFAFPPELSESERRALDLLPDDDREGNIGVALLCYAATAVTVAATAAAACSLCYRGQDINLDALSDGTINDLGPLGTARELLNKRSELLRVKIDNI